MALEREEAVKEESLGHSILREVFELAVRGLRHSKVPSINGLQM